MEREGGEDIEREIEERERNCRGGRKRRKWRENIREKEGREGGGDREWIECGEV